MPPAHQPRVGLDKESEKLALMTPRDYQFPVPTRVTDITGRRLDTDRRLGPSHDPGPGG